MVCVKCGQELLNDSQFCFACGEKTTGNDFTIATDGRFCIACGQKMLEDSLFCSICGAGQPAEEPEESPSGSQRFCIMCGQKLFGDSQFCFACGAKTAEDEVEKTPVPIEKPQPVVELIELPQAEKTEEPKDVHSSYEPDEELQKKPEVKPEPEPAEEIKTPEKQTKKRKLTIALSGLVVVLLAVVIGLGVFVIRDRMQGGGRIGRSGLVDLIGIDPEDLIDGGYYITRVAEGHITGQTDMTIGAAFERVLGNRQWVHFTDVYENHYVSIFGDTLYHGEMITIETTFQFSWDGASFEPINMRFDGTEVDRGFMLSMLDYIFDVARR